MKWFLCFTFLFAPLVFAEGSSLTEQKKEEGERELKSIQERMRVLKKSLEQCYEQVSLLHKRESPEEEFKAILSDVNTIRAELLKLEKRWQEEVVLESKEDENFALWDQEETTLAQLIMEYGAPDFLYVIPPEMANVKLNLHSNIPIPRESWSEVLEILLAHNGIGVKKLNAYSRQLYVFKQDPAAIQVIAYSPETLQLAPTQSRVFYLFSPPPELLKTVFQFFERFSDNKQTFVYQVGGKIAVVSSKEEIEKLNTLYQTVWEEERGKVARVVPVVKLNVKEMEKILTAFFGEAMEKSRPPFGKIEQEGLSLFSLPQGNALILIGPTLVVDRAEKIIHETEEQLQDPCEMTVSLYTCRHSDPTDLAKILEKVYASLLVTPAESSKENVDVSYSAQGAGMRTPDGYAPTPPLVVSPPSLQPAVSTHLEVEEGLDHFVPDPKTGNLLMVVRRDALVKIKELLKKLDVPKKMVQIEVLLFEKRISDQNNFGLNFLKLGSHRDKIQYEGFNAPSGKGVLQFFLHGGGSNHLPAFDFIYSFLMTQDDIQLNAAPSLVTVNQTPATIKIVEELSINNGAAPVDTNKGTTFEKSFTRAQYGIIIVVTPTIHIADEEAGQQKGFVTLKTNITFDTTKDNREDRPLVDRRNIENEVRVADGETVILGGLRRRATQDSEEKIPFLGEIPGLGKLFGSTKLIDTNTEMFFFITPKIILDTKEEMEKLRAEALKKRPGDIPEFLERMVEAREKEKKRFFAQSVKIFYGIDR